jgi:hypothetical protein
MTPFKALGSRFRKTMAVYSHDIIEAGFRFILKVNNQFAGSFLSHAAAVDALKGLSNGTNDALVESLSGNTTNEIRRRRATDRIRRLYSVKYISVTNAGTVWNDWTDRIVRLFLSTPHPSEGSGWRGVRAFGANYNPSEVLWVSQFDFSVPSPSTSSPWHNILYELINEDYTYGYRSFHFHFPFGSYNNESWMCTPIEWEDAFVSTTDPLICPARWKGFWEAIKQLCDGTFPAPAGGRSQITDPLDIQIYFNGASGFREYRDFMHSVWTTAGGGTAGDAAVKALLDRFIARVVSMKPAEGKGILTVCLDAAARSATSSCVHLHRSLPDYKSDFCELADWYVANKIRNAGIMVTCESRPWRVKVRAEYSDRLGVDYNGTTGAETYTGWSRWTGDTSWAWFSNPAVTPAEWKNIPNEDADWTHIIMGSFLADESKNPYGSRTKVFNGAAIRDLVTHPAATGNIYTPYQCMLNLYTVADMLQDVKWRQGDKTKDWFSRKGHKQFITYGIDLDFMGGVKLIQPSTDSTYTAHLGPAARYTWQNGDLSYMPATWNLASFTAAPTTFAGSYWSTTSKSFFNTNVRNHANLGAYLDNITTVLLTNGRPPGAPGTETEWGGDSLYLGSVDAEMRTP